MLTNYGSSVLSVVLAIALVVLSSPTAALPEQGAVLILLILGMLGVWFIRDWPEHGLRP